MIRSWLLRFLIKCIFIVEPCKDRFFSRTLHQIADFYDPEPTGQWGWYDEEKP